MTLSKSSAKELPNSKFGILTPSFFKKFFSFTLCLVTSKALIGGKTFLTSDSLAINSCGIFSNS